MSVSLSIDGAWHDACARLLKCQDMKSRYGLCRESLGYSFTLLDLDRTWLTNTVREASTAYAAAKFFWYISGTRGFEMLMPYYETDTSNYCFGKIPAHGPYIAADLPKVLEILTDEPHSRQAVIGLRNDAISLHYMIRGGALQCICNMRSSNLWLDLPYDVFAFTCLQRMVASTLGIKTGAYIHNVGNLHLYEDNFEDAAKAILPKTQNAPRSVKHSWGEYSTEDGIVRAKDCIPRERAARTNTKMTDAEANAPEAGPMLNDLLNCCRRHFGWENRVVSPLLNWNYHETKHE